VRSLFDSPKNELCRVFSDRFEVPLETAHVSSPLVLEVVVLRVIVGGRDLDTIF
jgi:hypothetical protein